MAIVYSPNIVTEGLILLLDSKNSKSYSGTGSTFTDLSGRGNHHSIIGSPTFSNGAFTLDGSTQGFTIASALSGVTKTCSVVLWYKTTDIQELWVRGNQNNGVYISASNNNNYYHSSAGPGIANYVDLNSVANPYAAGYKNNVYHMWEAKNVDFSGWTYFEWFQYPGGWQLAGDITTIMVYDRVLTTTESQKNYYALIKRYT